MTREKNGLPSRKLEPEDVRYCALTQEKFNSLVNRVKEIVDGAYGNKHQIAISIESFDEPFYNTDDLAKGITDTEWKNLKEIHVDIYLKGDYNPTVEIKLGREASWFNVGMRVETLEGTVIQKVAARESIRLLLQDYTRKVRVSSRVFWITSTLIVVVGMGFVLRNYPKVYGQIFILLIFLTPWGAISLHHYLFPNFEPLNESGKTKWEKWQAGFWATIAIVGFLFTVLGFKLTPHK